MTDFDYTHIATAYLIIGTIGFIVNTIVIYIKCHEKKHYSNITYSMMIQLATADNVALTANTWCGAVFIYAPQLKCEPVERLFGFCSFFAWYSASYFLCFIAFTRFICITKREATSNQYFGRKMKFFMILMPWSICFAYYSSFLWWPDVPLARWYDNKVSWDFNVDESSFGRWLVYQNIVSNSLCVVVQVAFNGLTLKWLRKERNAILTLSQTKNRRRETKLFFQCFVNCCFFAGTFTMFMSCNSLMTGEYGVAPYLIMSFTWIMHHCANSIIYFLMN
uniref:Uncharacterized protein n=1 Tax=Romanomermis culicivorax TaxID=13658 RepID=A0A915KJM9_ROMCU